MLRLIVFVFVGAVLGLLMDLAGLVGWISLITAFGHFVSDFFFKETCVCHFAFKHILGKITHGRCGKKAIPLAVLGAEVTVFDISEDNRRYALEVAEANYSVDYFAYRIFPITAFGHFVSDFFFKETCVCHFSFKHVLGENKF